MQFTYTGGQASRATSMQICVYASPMCMTCVDTNSFRLNNTSIKKSIVTTQPLTSYSHLRSCIFSLALSSGNTAHIWSLFPISAALILSIIAHCGDCVVIRINLSLHYFRECIFIPCKQYAFFIITINNNYYIITTIITIILHNLYKLCIVIMWILCRLNKSFIFLYVMT